MSYMTGKVPYDVPKPFEGTDEEVKENRSTHHWVMDGLTPVCMNCDAKEWHIAADYPCGTEPPRITIWVE